MCDNYIRLIPSDPQFVPEPNAQQAAKIVLSGFVPEAAAIEATVTNEVMLVDNGENFERVSCPYCLWELDEDTWAGMMDAACVRNSFPNLTTTTPCCGATTSLNDLLYEWPLGFARFVLEAENPNSMGLDDDQVGTIENVLGCKLRQIWAHY